MSATAIMDGTRRQLRERIRSLPVEGTTRDRIRRLRALLEEMGVHCDDTAELQDADGVLLVSTHGTDAVIAARLDEDQRLEVYARIVARLLVGDLHEPIDAKVEYRGRAPRQPGDRHEREEDGMVASLSRALVEGRLDTAPRTLFEDVPKLQLAFTPKTAKRSTLGGFHLWSDFWYRRSNLYRRWRSRRDVSEVIHRICIVLDPGAAARPG
jgi:hypothetical protein